MFEPLEDAIAGLYRAFVAERPRAVVGCPCCTSAEELARLVAAPRQALGPADLDAYAAAAITTVGTTEDFRYYWPRLAELAIRDQLITDTEIVFGKPLYGGHHKWPIEERQALLRLAAALGERFAADEIEEADVDMWVCAIGLLSENLADPRTFLRPLLGETGAARANLHSLVDWNLDRVQKRRRLTNAFWENAPESASRVLDWLVTEARALDLPRGQR